MFGVILTALAVGGATMVGVAIGFLFKNIPDKWNDLLLGFAAGIMMAALVFGLIMPALDYGDDLGIAVVVAGIFLGALFLNFIGCLVPFENLSAEGVVSESRKRILMFVIAMAIHNLPEGMACGVAIGTGDISTAVSVSLGISLQNLPEGMVVVAPMIAAGIGKRKALLIALSTGVVEILGTFLGYVTASLSGVLMPFVLSFAAGTMLYVVVRDMIPEMYNHGHTTAVSYSLIIGFCAMLVMDWCL